MAIDIPRDEAGNIDVEQVEEFLHGVDRLDRCDEDRQFIRALLAAAWDDGVEATLDDVPGGDEYACSIASYAEWLRLRNPYGP